MTSNVFEIGAHSVGAGREPLFLFDIGTMFNQDIAKAERMVDTVLGAGITVVKGEILHSADICLDDNTQEIYLDEDGKPVSERYRELIERKALPLATYERLIRQILARDAAFIPSIYDLQGVHFAKDMGCAALKVASSNITHQPLIESAVRTELPVILDTGKANLGEISRAVVWAIDAGATKLIIEHSPLAPPNPIEKHELRFMLTLGDTFQLPYGLSDHHSGEEMLYDATAMGASVLEKGLMVDADPYDQDYYHALPLSRVRDVRQKCLNIHHALGTGFRHFRSDRQPSHAWMGIVAGVDLPEGAEISTDTASFAFPSKGVPTEYWHLVRGKTLRVPKERGCPIHWEDILMES